MGVYCRRTKKGEPRYGVDYYDPNTYDPTTGKAKRIRYVVGPHKKDAEAEWHLIQTNILTKGMLAGSIVRRSPSFEEWARTYLRDRCIRNAPKTLEMKRSEIELQIEFFGRRHHLRMNGVRTLGHVMGYVRWRQQLGHRLYEGRTVSPRTINIGLSILRHLWNCAKAEGHATGENPVTHECFLSVDEHLVELLTQPQYETVLQACVERDARQREPGAGLHHLIPWLRFTGARKGESLALNVNDVNWVLGCFTFRQTKGGRPRTIPLVDHLVRILQDVESVDGYYFGGPRAANRFRMAWDDVREATGLTRLRLHWFRHMASSHMQRQGVDDLSINSLLGHKSSGRGMLAHYGHATPEGLRNALVKLAEPFPSENAVVTAWSHGTAIPLAGEIPVDRNLPSAADL